MTMESYIIFWKREKINRILRNGDMGPLSVLYGGPHQSQPPLGKVGVGDRVFVINVTGGVLYLFGRMSIDAIVDAGTYLRDTLGTVNPEHMWDTYWNKHKDEVTHKIPTTCADNAALGVDGTSLRLREVPADIAARIHLGPKPGRENPLRSQNGLISTVGLAGYYRRLSYDSAALFDELLVDDI